METLQFYLSTAIGILLIAMAILFLLVCIAFMLQVVFDSDKCRRAGYILLCSLAFVALITLTHAVGWLGVTVLDSADFFFVH